MHPLSRGGSKGKETEKQSSNTRHPKLFLMGHPVPKFDFVFGYRNHSFRSSQRGHVSWSYNTALEPQIMVSYIIMGAILSRELYWGKTYWINKNQTENWPGFDSEKRLEKETSRIYKKRFKLPHVNKIISN